MLVSGIGSSGSSGNLTLPGGTAVLEPLAAGCSVLWSCRRPCDAAAKASAAPSAIPNPADFTIFASIFPPYPLRPNGAFFSYGVEATGPV
jgi:hypothetical protein